MIPCEQRESIKTLKDEVQVLVRAGKERDKRLQTGDMTLASIDMTLLQIRSAQELSRVQDDKMFKRMFVDNGKPCMQSALANNQSQLRLQWYFIGGIIVALIGSAVKGVFI